MHLLIYKLFLIKHLIKKISLAFYGIIPVFPCMSSRSFSVFMSYIQLKKFFMQFPVRFYKEIIYTTVYYYVGLCSYQLMGYIFYVIFTPAGIKNFFYPPVSLILFGIHSTTHTSDISKHILIFNSYIESSKTSHA